MMNPQDLQEIEKASEGSPDQFQPSPDGYYDFKTLPKDLQKALLDLKSEVDLESRPVRDKLIPMWRRNEAFWKGIQRGIYSEIARNYVSSQDLARMPELSDIDFNDYERCINITRAHGEAILAALSSKLPNPIFPPADADNPDDIATSKASRRIAELISSHNDGPLRLIKGLYHLYIHGIAFGYDTYHRDKKYGIIRQANIEFKQVEKQVKQCPVCDSEIEDQGLDPMNDPTSQMEGMIGEDPFAQDPFAPNPMQMGTQCASCGEMVQPVDNVVVEEIPQFKSFDETPKGRSIIEVYGPLNVTIPFFVKDLKHAGFLKLDTDLDLALIKELYQGIDIDGAPKDELHRADRTPVDQPFYEGENQGTVSRIWFRPWMFNRLKDDAVRKQLRTLFPNGCYAVFVQDDIFAEACDESMDDCWEATIDPTSDWIHADPKCNPIIPIQKMLNDLVSLTLDTIEQSIPLNLVDQTVVNLEELAKRPADPGELIGAKPRAGQNLQGAIASSQVATLSRGIEEFNAYLEKSGQFVIGSFPSIYGGELTGGSNTFGEYRESKEQALQRLSIIWKIISTWWVRTLYKAVLIYTNNVIEDEHYTKKVGNASFINVWIKRSELQGKIGEVLLENSDQLPVSWSQQRQMVIDMMAQKNPQFDATIFHPENTSYIWQLLGLFDLYIPGDHDREKELRAIFEIVQNEPQIDPVSGQPLTDVEPALDNPQVHAEVLKAFLLGDVGQDLKQSAPEKYQTLMFRLEQFNQLSAQEQSQIAPEEEQNVPEEQF
jgi:hypothetical protein